MRGWKPEVWAKRWDYSTSKVYMMRRREGVRKKDCPVMFSEDSILVTGPKTFRIIEKWQGDRMVLPKFIDRED